MNRQKKNIKTGSSKKETPPQNSSSPNSSSNNWKNKKKSGKSKGKENGFRHNYPEELRLYLTGTVDMKSTGKAYLLPDNSKLEDVFIAANHTKNALHGDKVRIGLFPKRQGRRLEGMVEEVLERNKRFISGIVQLNTKEAFLVPDATNMPVNVILDYLKLKGAQQGDKVLVKITDWPEHLNNPNGEISVVLGKPGENEVEMKSILAEYNFPLEYPPAAIQEAEKFSDSFSLTEIEGRKDFRKCLTLTIDPEDAKDFDDALSLQKLPNGHTEVGVHIADVSHYVKPGGLIDQEAYERGTSVYLVDRTVAMLPERLCNDLCSLKPNVDRLSFSVLFELDEQAKIISSSISRGIIHSDIRLTYEDAQKVIDAFESTEKVEPTETTVNENIEKAILELHKLAGILREKRFKTGAINFHSQEVRFKLDEKAKPIGVYIKESHEANFLIEEFMLLANKHVAEFIGKNKKEGGNEQAKTFVYRVHDEPNPDKLENFVDFVSKLGYKIQTRNRSLLVKSFNNLLEDVVGKAEQNMVETIAVRTMSKAFYSTDNIGHYGLAFPFYSHFTSPIRRYPDLMVHRLLDHYLHNGKSTDKEEFESYCLHCSDMERKAAEAERASVKYKQAEYLADEVGKEFNGVISGVSKWGLFVVLDENFCEGMVPLRSLKDDFYHLDEENYRVVGNNYGREYKLGDPVRIKVQNVDLNKKQMNFIFADV